LHVLIEKPLSVGEEGIAELTAAAREKRREIRVAYIYRFMATVRRARELLESDCCGDVRHVSVCAGQHFPTFRPAYRTIYYARRESGGGAIQDALTHLLHAVEWLVSPVERVLCHASHQVLEGVEVEDTVNVTARLTNGALASFALNQFQAVSETILTFHGTKGSLRMDVTGNRIGKAEYDGQGWKWEQMPCPERDDAFTEQARDFLAATRGDPDTGCTLGEGEQTLRCNLAALQSAESGQEVLL
jgi:predicted dehydrogenase